MKSFAFLFWAYNVIWIGIAAYIWLTYSRLRRTDRRVEKLEERVRRLSADAD